MASFTVSFRKLFPAGNRVWEIAQVTSGTGALSTTTALDFTSALRTIDPGGILYGRDGTVAQLNTAAVTFSNATSFPGNALITFSGMSASAGEKRFFVVSVGRR